MKTRNLFKRKLELFYQVVQKKRKNINQKMLMQTTQKFRRIEINKLNENKIWTCFNLWPMLEKRLKLNKKFKNLR